MVVTDKMQPGYYGKSSLNAAVRLRQKHKEVVFALPGVEKWIVGLPKDEAYGGRRARTKQLL